MRKKEECKILFWTISHSLLWNSAVVGHYPSFTGLRIFTRILIFAKYSKSFFINLNNARMQWWQTYIISMMFSNKVQKVSFSASKIRNNTGSFDTRVLTRLLIIKRKCFCKANLSSYVHTTTSSFSCEYASKPSHFFLCVFKHSWPVHSPCLINPWTYTKIVMPKKRSDLYCGRL